MLETGVDQASGLRRLFARSRVRLQPLACVRRGDEAAGFAVGLARALQARGRRVLLIDADRWSIGPAAGLAPRRELADWLDGAAEFADVACADRHGVRVLPAARGLPALAEQGALAGWLARLGGASVGADTVLLAAAPAQLAYLPDDGEVLVLGEHADRTGTYALLKRLASVHGRRRLRVALAGAPSASAARAEQTRLAEAAARFLGVALGWAGPAGPAGARAGPDAAIGALADAWADWPLATLDPSAPDAHTH